MRGDARQREREQTLATGRRVTALMAQNGISVAVLAAAVRVQQSTLQSLCAGQRRIPPDVLDSIARVLGTTSAYLMASTDDPGLPGAAAV
jgi:plasmid maintenance system antidote protein VapI